MPSAYVPARFQEPSTGPSMTFGNSRDGQDEKVSLREQEFCLLSQVDMEPAEETSLQDRD